MLRQLELIRAQYEMFANPYYNDAEGILQEPLQQLQNQIEALTE